MECFYISFAVVLSQVFLLSFFLLWNKESKNQSNVYFEHLKNVSNQIILVTTNLEMQKKKVIQI